MTFIESFILEFYLSILDRMNFLKKNINRETYYIQLDAYNLILSYNTNNERLNRQFFWRGNLIY